MSALQSVSYFLKQNLPAHSNNFSAEILDGKIVTSNKSIGLEQYRLGFFEYSIIIVWERLAYRKLPPACIYAMIIAWINEHYNDPREPNDMIEPEIDIEFDDENQGSLAIKLDLADELIVKEDQDGVIPIKGKFYSIVLPEILTANSIVIQHD